MPAANALYKHVLDSSYWLCDTDVNAALNLIKAKFSLVLGLHDTLLGAILDFLKQTSDRWVRVIHDNVNHWVVAAKVEKTHVFVYDSLGGDPNNVLGCISSLLMPYFSSCFSSSIRVAILVAKDVSSFRIRSKCISSQISCSISLTFIFSNSQKNLLNYFLIWPICFTQCFLFCRLV